jgi:hypothetical protein
MKMFLNNLKIVNFENVIHGKKLTTFVSLLKERKITLSIFHFDGCRLGSILHYMLDVLNIADSPIWGYFCLNLWTTMGT